MRDREGEEAVKWTCPSCSTEHDVSMKSMVPDEQRITLELKRADHELFDATTIGGVIVQTEKLLTATAKSIGENVTVFVSGLRLEPGSASIDLIVANAPKKKARKR